MRYFAPFVPHVITILRWRNLKRALIAAYLIALVLQLVTSPFFRSLIHPTSLELAWSPYQAVWNVLGVIVMDLILSAWSGLRRGAAAGGVGPGRGVAAGRRAGAALSSWGESACGENS